jgi:hypothetical protein
MNEDEMNEEWAWLSGSDTDYYQVLPSIKGLAGYSTYGYSAYPLLYQVWVIQ